MTLIQSMMRKKKLLLLMKKASFIHKALLINPKTCKIKLLLSKRKQNNLNINSKCFNQILKIKFLKIISIYYCNFNLIYLNLFYFFRTKK